jgi:alkylresorcinol/alkylpyrone synthase
VIEPRVRSLATAVPAHVVRQPDAKRMVEAIFSGGSGEGGAPDWARLYSVFDHGAIETRRTCMPLDWYAAPHDFAERNARYVEHALLLGAEAAGLALGRAGIEARDVDHVVFVSSTGLATPSVDALLANELGFPARVRRTPVWGLWCAGGAAGLARAGAFARSEPGTHVLLVTVELCSLTFQAGDRTKRNLVAASLFADGAAAAVVSTSPGDASVAGACGHLDMVGSGSTFWGGTLDVMGWEVDGDGLHVVFSRDIPAIVRARVRPSLEDFLARHDLTLDQVRHVAAHPGGLKVLDAYRETLGLSEGRVRHARAVLREHGNMSAPTCLFVLERLVEGAEIAPGEYALVTALGPGFGVEYVLLKGAAA